MRRLLRPILIASALLLSGPSKGIADTFAGVVVGGDGASNLAAADFNGDGLTDLAVASRLTSTVAIYLRRSDETLPIVPTHTVSTGAAAAKDGSLRREAIAARDVNQDGKPDLVVADSASGTVSLLTGRGDGSFDQPLALQTLTVPTGIALGDFNRDGHPDIAVASQGANRVTLLLGTEGGKFTLSGEFAAGVQPTSVTAGDFGAGPDAPGRDGNLDIAVTASGEGQIAVLFGDGHGGFSTPKKLDALEAASVTAVDLNGDGAVELATCNTAAHVLGVIIGLSQGTFGCFSAEYLLAEFGEDVLPSGLAAADFDGDGHPDLAVSARSARAERNGVYLLLNRPKPGLPVSFAAPVFCPTLGGPPAAIAAVPTKAGAGAIEVAVTDGQSDRVWVLRGDGKGGFANCASAYQLNNKG